MLTLAEIREALLDDHELVAHFQEAECYVSRWVDGSFGWEHVDTQYSAGSGFTLEVMLDFMFTHLAPLDYWQFEEAV